MTLLVTGATGFVMSVLGRYWLDAFPDERLAVLDTAAPDAAALRYSLPSRTGFDVVVADVTRPDTWRSAFAGGNITHIVHGATITPLSRGTAAEATREPEAENPGRIIDVNSHGTVGLLDWARTLPSCRDSSTSVRVRCTSITADRPGEPLPEDGYVHAAAGCTHLELPPNSSLSATEIFSA